MKIRVKFSRKSEVKFLGHLDIMRTFQRAFIRANVKMAYSIGFNPHQKMSFAQPLGVGVTSEGEYLDAEIEDGQDLNVIAENLDRQMGEGFDVLTVKKLAGNAEKAMAVVRYAEYVVSAEESELPEVDIFNNEQSVMAVKKTKSGESEIDIRPLVYSLKKTDNTYEMILQAGSENNLKPELLVQEIFKMAEIEFDRLSLRIHRKDLMAKNRIPLIDFQTE